MDPGRAVVVFDVKILQRLLYFLTCSIAEILVEWGAWLPEDMSAWEDERVRIR